MTKNNAEQSLSPMNHLARNYEEPILTTIGHAKDVILGVSGGGDDLMGYSFPEFEFERDDETAA